MIGRTQNQKQLPKSVLYAAACAVSAWGVLGSHAQAGDIVRSATSGTLNLTTSWDGGVVPASGDVAVWDTNSAIAGQIGADTSWAGIKIIGPSAAVSINGTNVLTLGASGIDMSAATQNLTIQTGNTTTPASGITLGAAQTWNIGTGRTLIVGNSASGVTGAAAATITKTGAGTVNFNNVLDTFAGGIILNAGAVVFNSNSTGSGGVISNGPLGIGALTINGGTLSVSSTSGRDIANDVNVGGDFTIGITGNNRLRSAGLWNLGGTTRNVTLNNNAATLTNGTEQFSFIAQAGKNATVSNGTVRFVAGANATAASPSVVGLSTSGGVIFQNNAGITLGNNVALFTPNAQGQAGATSPTLTLEAGSNLLLTNATQTRSFTASSLNGAGTIGGYQTDGTTTAATVTVDAASGTATFSGKIQDSTTIFANAGNTVVSFTKNNGGTQVLSGANTYTGATSVNGGTLVVGAAQAIPQVSATTVGGSGATLKLGTTAQTTLNSLTLNAGGKVDLGKGQLLLNNGGGATALSAVAAQVASGRAGGDGFYSSNAVAGTSDIGFKDTGTGIYLRYTLAGDADLNGTVDFNDFLVLQNNFNQAGSFATGDFNYSGNVDFNDFLMLQNNFNQSVTGAAVAPATASQVAAMQSFAATVPEPASLAVIGLGAVAMLRRRRA